MIHERIPLTVPDADGPAELITYAPCAPPLSSAPAADTGSSPTGRGNRWPCGSRGWASPRSF